MRPPTMGGRGRESYVRHEHHAGGAVMRGHLLFAFAVIAGGTAAACHGGGPTTPTSARPATPPPTSTGTPAASSGEPFDVTGVVTDEQGAPVAGAAVTMAHWLAGTLYRPAVLTDASGGYAFQFSSNPWIARRAAVRRERKSSPTGMTGIGGPSRPPVRTSSRMCVCSGSSAFPPAVPSSCLSQRRTENALAGCTGPCGRMRVAAVTDGNLTIDASPTAASAARPQLQVCCLSGDDRYGNPVTLPVAAGVELWVEVGQTAAGVVPSQTVITTTSLQPLADPARLGIH